MLLIVMWIAGCGVIQIKTKKPFDSSPPTVDAPADADPGIRDTWNQAEVARARALRDEDKPQFIDFGKYYGACWRYVEIFQIDPGFTAGALFQKVTVQDRMKEMCQKAVDYAKRCRGQGKTQGCGDAATVTQVIAVLAGQPAQQPVGVAPSAQPALGPGSGSPPGASVAGGEMIRQEVSGQQLEQQARDVSRLHSSKQIATCEALSRLAAIEQQVPADLREVYRATMNLERIPPEGIPGFVRPDQLEAARAATGEQRTIILTGVEMQLRSETPAHEQGSLEVLIVIDRFRRGTYKRATASSLGEVGVRRDLSVEALRGWAEVFRCLGSYTPSEKSLKGADVAMIMDGEIARLEQSRQAQANEEARCQADPKCVKQREIDSVAGELCPLLAEIDEIAARLKARLKEAEKYGVINKADQYEDMEDKQFCEERAAELKRDYREVAGKAFQRKVCKEYEW